MEKWYVTQNTLRWNSAARQWTATEAVIAVNLSRYAADLLIEHHHELSAAPQQAGREYRVGPVSTRTW